jgi:hypothetical protein
MHPVIRISNPFHPTPDPDGRDLPLLYHRSFSSIHLYFVFYTKETVAKPLEHDRAGYHALNHPGIVLDDSLAQHVFWQPG